MGACSGSWYSLRVFLNSLVACIDSGSRSRTSEIWACPIVTGRLGVKQKLVLGDRVLQSVEPEGRFKGRDTILSPATIPRPSEVGARGFDLEGAALCTVEPAFRYFTPP
ncbi:hypothetical protein chiPu_0027672 [Chiloscyllium punctatum]|uniref:Uncharacterized protein n=1 Tax=Chiloscyllium punctatum TaxID=137246 RepID=A0A401TMD9_CHIPU|nr:hypothetical protein [Chiloscyllium punctatum]